jgi:tetratricopeptide (TPR) repeat protein
MRSAWRVVTTLLVAACLWGGAGRFDAAWAVNPQDAKDCGSQETTPATAPRRVEACTRVLAEMKNNKPVAAAAYSARAFAYTQLQNSKAAITDCAEALRLDPTSLLCLLVRASAYGDMRQFERAFADINKAIQLNPKVAELYAVRGMIHYVKGGYESAFTDAAEAIRIKPELALGYVVRAGAYYERGDRIRALADVNQAIRLQANFDGAYAARAWLYFKMGQPAKAKADAEQALGLDPRNRGALEVRGCLAIDANDMEAGLADLTQAIDMGSNTYDPFLCRAAAMERSGMNAEASADYRKVLELAIVGRDSPAAKAKARARLAAIQSGQVAQTGPTGKAPEEIYTEESRTPPQAATTAAIPPAAQTAPQQAAIQAPAQLASTAPPGRRIALVIGMGAYANVTPLTNPPSDAHAVAEAFQRLGFVEVVEHRDLTRVQLEKALKDFGDRAQNSDWAVIYYAGHGVEVDGINYLVPVDAALAKAEHVEDEALPLPRLLSKAEQARKLRLVILDACRNNPFKMSAAAGGKTRSIGRGLGRVEPAGGVLVAFAARDGSTADDGANGHSPFTKALLENVEKPGLEISLLFRKVRNAVLTSTNNRQEPFTYGSLPDEGLYFREAGK